MRLTETEECCGTHSLAAESAGHSNKTPSTLNCRLRLAQSEGSIHTSVACASGSLNLVILVGEGERDRGVPASGALSCSEPSFGPS